MKKAVFINWHNGNNLNNGPVNMFNNLTAGLNKLPDEVTEVISPESFNGNFKAAVKYIAKLIFSRDKLSFIVNGNGLKMPYCVFLMSFLNRSHRYFFISHGLRIVEDKYIGIENRTYHFFERLLIRNFHNIIAVSQFLKNQILENYNRRKPIYVITSGMEISSSYEVEALELQRDIRLIMTGGVKKIKGIEETVELVKSINRLMKPYKLYLDIYGGFEDEELLKAVIQSADASISYKGKVSKEELFKAYGKAHFSIALSHSDTFNMSVAESMLCGTPAIISANCGISQIMTEMKQGIVVRDLKNCHEDIVKFLDNITNNINDYNLMRKECLALKEELGLDTMVNKYMEVVLGD